MSRDIPHRDSLRLGGVCAILAGVLFLASGLSFVLFLAGQVDPGSLDSISRYYVSAPGARDIHAVVTWGAALAALLAIAPVLALADLLRGSGLWITWASVLAIVGLAISALANVTGFAEIGRLLQAYASAAEGSKMAVEAAGVSWLDPDFRLRGLLLGSWLLVANGAALRGRQLPRPPALLGLLAGALTLLRVLGIEPGPLAWVGEAVYSALLVPAWFIWTGFALVDRTEPAAGEEQVAGAKDHAAAARLPVERAAADTGEQA